MKPQTELLSYKLENRVRRLYGCFRNLQKTGDPQQLAALRVAAVDVINTVADMCKEEEIP